MTSARPARLLAFDPRDRPLARAVVELWRRSFEHGVGILDPNPIEAQLEYFDSTLVPAHRVVTAWNESGLVGFVAYTPESVGALYVAVPQLGRGIGTQLLELARDESAGSLWLYTFARNARARAFYERRGFVDVGHGFENMWQLEDVRYEWRRS